MPRIPKQPQFDFSGSETVGFKLDKNFRDALATKARQEGKSRNVLARDLVISALVRNDDLDGALLMLNQQLLALREDLALVAEVLLSHAGKTSPDEARKWADENIKPV